MKKNNYTAILTAVCLTSAILTGCGNNTAMAEPEKNDVLTSAGTEAGSNVSDDLENEGAEAAGMGSIVDSGYAADEKFGGGNHLQQTLDVAGEEWKLVVSYDTGNTSADNWKITASKYLNMDVRTEGLSEGYQVYIDNVHIESSICSLKEAYNGILVDDMDDHTHTSLYPGFPINDTTDYYGIFGIGGYSETLINGYAYGYAGYTSGSIKEKRVTESDLQDAYVYGNKFQLIYDLWIQPNAESVPYMKSVVSEFIIPTAFNIKFTDNENRNKIKGIALWNGTNFNVDGNDGHIYTMSVSDDGEMIIEILD